MGEVLFKTMAEGLRFPEGPVVMKDGSVILVEVARRAVTRCHPDGRTEVVAQLDGGPNGAAVGPDGALYICNNGGFNWHETDETGLRPHGQATDYSGGRIERLDLKTGELKVLYTASDKAPLKGPNDLVFDAHGGFYFTDHGKIRPRDMDRGTVCYAKADGSFIREVVYPIMSPNGVGLSPDGATLYVAETFTCRLWAFTIASPGQLELLPWPQSPNGGRFVAGLGGYQGFDSLAVDAAGNICVATIYSGAITVVSPDGSKIEAIKTPDPFATNICFGGSDMRTAYVTMSSTGKLMTADWPTAGLRLEHEA
ncbi:SMP-30/gluconolactonase/LRE family protein [Tianweitania sediminis]|jgi:gluconolactonase|uniref:SMP-30/gluconolactonase/LRE family protein n=1 Tax=Tianweitania sediminis TaxID=1502156 RepID=A0A8J7UG22_9HYPH|nr:SMP-30/gluconolactonase/LRE family protein [Tianweitania sediminis]MBP0437704.1 SMP-30/gluconolactonase/LRE family protein [Tianweitania sediminis]HEV7418145.1 SMP-30/gluconolactonase/LRE family protein [Tianweitania sediminis]